MKDARWYAWLARHRRAGAAPLYIAIFGLATPVVATAVLMIIGGSLLFLHYTPTQAVLQNMVEPQMRATAAFAFFFITSMVGYGLGPALLGFLSDVLAARAFGAWGTSPPPVFSPRLRPLRWWKPAVSLPPPESAARWRR